MTVSRRRFLAGTGVLAGAVAVPSAIAACGDGGTATAAHATPLPEVSLPVALAGLPARQHAWEATEARDPDGNPVAPRFDRLLFFDVVGSPSVAHVRILESALRQAYAAATYLSSRRQHLALLESHGKNAWLVGNWQLEAELRALERERAYDDPEEAARLQAAVADGLKAFEFALRRRVEGAGGERARLGAGDQVPPGFRALVEEYYRSLARGGGR